MNYIKLLVTLTLAVTLFGCKDNRTAIASDKEVEEKVEQILSQIPTVSRVLCDQTPTALGEESFN